MPKLLKHNEITESPAAEEDLPSELIAEAGIKGH
jgi:hypothetical protein